MIINRNLAVMITAYLFVGLATYGQTSSEIIEEKNSSQPWTKAPDSFRGVKFGASEDDLRKVVGNLKCNVQPAQTGVMYRHCFPTNADMAMTVNGSRLLDTYQFVGGRLLAVTVLPFPKSFRVPSFSPVPSFSAVVLAFTERYGPPTIATKTRCEWKNEQMLVMIIGELNDTFDSALVWTAEWQRLAEKNTSF